MNDRELFPQAFPAPYPLIADLQHLGEEKQQQVGPGLSVALRRQSQEVRHGLAADAAADIYTKECAFLGGNQAQVETCCSTVNRNEPPRRPAQAKNRQEEMFFFLSSLEKC